MKTIVTTFAATLFAASVSAADIYHGFADGNPDLQGGYTHSQDSVTAVRSGIGSDFDRYQGWADGNPDLFSDRQLSTSVQRSGPADVYRGFAGNPDLM